MFRNYLKSAWRNLWRRKGFSAINILGLAVGMAATMLILLWIGHEVSYDRFYKNLDRIYLLHNRNKHGGTLQVGDNTPEIMAATLQQDYPHVDKVARYNNVTFLLTSGEKEMNVQGAFTDSSFLSIFSFPLLKGDSRSALKGEGHIVITQKLAEKLFGRNDAMGKTIRIDSTDYFTVTGIMKDLPDNTQFDFEYLLPWRYKERLGWADNNWTNLYTSTYVLLQQGFSGDAFNKRVKNIIIDHAKDADLQVFAQPMRRVYLYSKAYNGQLTAGLIDTIRLFIIIAAFILLIACINFMNLSTARSEKRRKEVGIRKTMGAHRGSLVINFIGESILLSFIAFLLALLMVQLSLPAFNQLVDRQLHISFNEPFFWLFAFVFILFTGILAGSYPAFLLSSFAPVKALKGESGKWNGLVGVRKILVITQFAFAVILIISTLVVARQIQHAEKRNMGYNKNNLVYAFTQGEVNAHYDLIKNDLLRSGVAVAVTRVSSPITKNKSSGWGYQWQGSTEAESKIDFLRLSTDADFTKTTGVQLKAGRDIDINVHPSDSTAMLLNEAAVKAMGLKEPIGQIIRRENYPQQWHVVGVLKNFILGSPYENIKPMMIIVGGQYFQTVHFRLNPAISTQGGLAKAEAIFKKYNPQYPFEYGFVDKSYANKFMESQRVGKMAALFAALTIFISCLGLFGLAVYIAESRTKEIGIRKVLGASVPNMVMLLSKDFLKLVVIAIIIAIPIAYLTMNNWLQNFAYRINISWWIFVVAGVLAIVIALVTVSWQAIRAARANPVKSLRTE